MGEFGSRAGLIDLFDNDDERGGSVLADERSRDRIQSIERGVAVLRAFDRHQAALNVAQIAQRCALPRPVVRRILLTFAHLGYVEGHQGLWSLTPRILELGAGYFAASSLPEIAHGYMVDVVNQTNETCSLGTLDGNRVIHVARVDTHLQRPNSIRVGERLPAHATAMGKVLLASLPDDVLDERLAEGPLDKYTPATITDVAELRERILRVRTDGYDLSVEELYPGQIAAAVPITVEGGGTVGALGISSITVLETESTLLEHVVPILQTAAAGMSSAYRNANPHLFRAGVADLPDIILRGSTPSR